MGADIVMYVQKKNKTTNKWEMLPLKHLNWTGAKYEYVDLESGRNHGLYEFLRNYSYAIDTEEAKEIEKALFDNEEWHDFVDNWLALSYTKLQLIQFTTPITDKDRREYEEDEWHDDYENPVLQVNRIKELINKIKIALEFTDNWYVDSDNLRIIYYISY